MKSKKEIGFLTAVIIGCFIIFGFAISYELKVLVRPSDSPQALMQLASELEARGLWEGAGEIYRRYLDSSGLSQNERAFANFHLGEIYLDKLNDPTKALPCLFLARQLGDSDIKSKADKRIVEAFERLGKSLDAQAFLKETTALNNASSPQSDVVIAVVGDRKITLRDLEEEIQILPPSMQEQFKAPERKKEFLQSLVARQLMLNSARRKGLEDDPQIKILARHALETAMLAKYQEQEIDSKIRITDADVRAYYEAHKSEFVRRDEKGKEIPMSYQEAKERARMMLLEERRKTLLDDLLNRLQQAEKVELYLDKLTPK